MTKKQLEKLIKQLLDASFKDDKIIESQVGKSIKVLKTLPSPIAIRALSEYLKQVKRKEREHTMQIETIVPLSQIQIKKAKKIVERKFKINKVLVKINPEILGGFRLRVGDEIWDESILAKLNQVKEAIASSESRIQN